MKLPTFADPESLSYVYSLLQSSFDQMNENNNNSSSNTTAITRKRRRKSEEEEDDDDGSTNNHEEGDKNNKKNKKKKKEELKGILTSLLLLDEQEKHDQQHHKEVSEEEKLSLETNHKKKTKAMLQYYTNLDDYYSQVEESERVRRKKTRSMASAVAIAASSEGLEEGNSEGVVKSGGGGPQRRLWVKDRSGAWWDECNREDFPEEEFRKAFRMGRSTFDVICEELNSAIVKEDTTLRNAIPVRQRVAVCLWRLATGDPLRLVSKRFGLGISTCHKLVLEVCTAIKTVLMPKYLQWPDEVALRNIKGEFESISGIPNVVGSMYTSHVPIIAPKISVAAYFNKRHTERNQKTSYSITVQGVVDPRGVFTDVCIGWPGSYPDDQVLEKSALYQRANGGLLKGVWIVGSSGYPLMDWVLVPYTQQNLTWTQHAFNEKIGEIQKVAKDAFARLKERWCCLQKRTEISLTLYEPFLQKVPLFKGCSSAFIKQIATKIHEEFFLPGELVIEQGDVPDQLYFVYHGELHDIRRVDGDPQETITLHAYSSFGEVSFLCNMPPTSMVQAHEFCKVLRLDKKSFSDILKIYFLDGRIILNNLLEVKDSSQRRKLLESDFNLTIRNQETELAMRMNCAAYGGHLDILKGLIASGADPNKTDYDGRSPLHISASKGFVDISYFLVEQGVNINIADKFGTTPLLEAIKNGHEEVASLLINAGATLTIDDVGNFLCMTVAKQELDILKNVLACGINPNSKNYDQRTPLHIAASEGLCTMAELLLEAGASVLSKDRWGNTPLREARTGGNRTVIKMLEVAKVSQLAELSNSIQETPATLMLPSTDEIPKKRCTVFPFHPWDHKEDRREGVVLWVPQSIEELIKVAMKHLGISKGSCVLSEQGGKILHVDMINKDEKLFLVSEGQA